MANKSAESSFEKRTNIISGRKEMVHNMNIGNMILDAFKSKPDFIGQIDAATEEQITFQQMRENSVRLALWLQSKCYKNIIVSICTSNQMLAYIPFLAGLYLNAIINPWDESYFKDIIRIMYFLVENQPEIIFIDGSKYKQLMQAISNLNKYEEIVNPTIITFDRVENVVSLKVILDSDFDEAEIDKFSCEKTRPTTIMAVMFSSNATNYPGKAHLRYLAFTFPSNQEVPTMSSGDIGLWYGSLTWTYSMILIVRSIVSYVTVIKSSKFHDEDMYNMIEKYKVNWVFLQSSMCNQLFQTDIRKYNVSSLKQLVFGDSDLRSDIYEKFNKYLTDVSITQVYSISEACIIAAYQRSNNPIASSGCVASNVQLSISHITTKEAAFSYELGEVWYRFVCKWCNPTTCTSSYCSNYKAKKNTIDAKSSVAITSTWHCTGDYGFIGSDGKLFVIDKSHPAVSEVIVRSVPHCKDGEHPIAYIKKKNGAKVTREELEELVKKNLPDIYHLHGGLQFKTEMPYLPNGKIDRELV